MEELTDNEIMDLMEDKGWICNPRGWWHPPSCLAAWPFDEAKYMFLKDQKMRELSKE